MKTSIITSVFLALTLTTSAFAQTTEDLAPACQNKVKKLAAAFAEANKAEFGIPSTLGAVSVDPVVTLIGESGFGDGKGSYQINMKDGNVDETFEVNFTFRVITGPQCTVIKIEADYE